MALFVPEDETKGHNSGPIAKVSLPESPAGGLLMKAILYKSPCGDLAGVGLVMQLPLLS
jgi:hypothetical protein